MIRLVIDMNSIRTFFVRDKKALLVSILLAEAVGGLSALFVRGETDWYRDLSRPPASPPSWLFPIVWGILFLLMGIAAYRIYLIKKPEAKAALYLYGVNLAVNFFWPLFFFRLKFLGFSALWLALLLVVVLLTWRRFYALDRPAGNLLIPYLLWLAFALYLNIGIWTLN